MKKIFLAIAAMVLTAGLISAQDMAQATELYNNGATAISMKNWTEALDCFQKALAMGETIGEEAQELVANCKNAIPGVSLQISSMMRNMTRLTPSLRPSAKSQRNTATPKWPMKPRPWYRRSG